ncbi:DNA glycosylase AlkZ-like family protein, partial [Microbacterium sp. CPCC 204701]|uniref:DNA glycosylase AlkZ-like family protein n=1 Tax=Microbacterium sp. CPCC 204701 TaxID=2493084 RepID=UPI0013E30939
AAIGELTDTGELEPVSVAGWTTAGRPAPAWLHRDALVPRRVRAAAILTPFDPVVWFRDRAARLFGFEYRIEIYTPAPKRRYGYYSLPVLIDDDLVGRVDLKADRGGSTLLVQSAWWEYGRPADAAPRLAEQLQLAAGWQGLESVSISRWGDAVDDLADVMPAAGRHDAGPARPDALADDEPAEFAEEELAG